ncbi:MAG: hypothetical protein V1729_00240 [Candidatus Woesearchaeota archaeon]
MYSWRNFKDKVHRYWKLESFEKRGLLISIIVIAFIFSFREWGVEKFDPSTGFQNLLITLILVVITFLVREVAHRTVATWMGYRSQYKAWILGLVIGLVIAFLSNGRMPFIAAGALVITHLPIHRLGKAYYALSMKHLGWIALAAPIANMMFAVLIKTINLGLGWPLLEKLMMINIWIALFDMIPVPPFNGCRTFFGSRYVYVFMLGALIGCATLLSYLGGIAPIIGALILGSIVLLVFFSYIDKRW